ncbi:hypothetical protein [Stenotrophomonas sp. AB1(2024)]|jgi:hypothetical protein
MKELTAKEVQAVSGGTSKNVTSTFNPFKPGATVAGNPGTVAHVHWVVK